VRRLAPAECEARVEEAGARYDDADHEHPRWAPDGSSLVYFSGAATESEPGTLWEISALGGTPRRIASSEGEGDISHDGRRIAMFQTQGNRTVLAILERDGSPVQVKPLPELAEFASPRWSPDDRSIAFVGTIEIAFNRAVYVIDTEGGEARAVASAPRIQGLAWLPDNSGLVYASSVGSTASYPPIFNLRSVSKEEVPRKQGGSSRSATCRTSSRTSWRPAGCSRAASGCSRTSGGSRSMDRRPTT